MLKRSIVLIAIINSFFWQGCEYETIPGPVDCEENPVTLDVVSIGDSNCELVDGRIEVAASGGTESYQFVLGEEEPQVSPVFEGIGAGVYQLTVFDKNKCSDTAEATVKNINGLNITFQTTEAGCNSSNGALTVTPTDGTQPYQFKINDGAFTSSNSFTGLSAGNYNLVVKDASGCEVNQTIRVRSGISFSASIATIFKNNCSVCHAGSQFPDFRQFKNIHDNAELVKKVTGDRTMPPGGDGALTQAEINLIACWVDDGALNN